MGGCGNFAVGNPRRSPPRRPTSAKPVGADAENEILLPLQAITFVSSLKATAFE
jgi:hypothetical protein